MNRITRQIIKYLEEGKEKYKEFRMNKELRKEVDINGTGTNKYRIKKGPNKDKVIG
jgi:hypothetical protein